MSLQSFSNVYSAQVMGIHSWAQYTVYLYGTDSVGKSYGCEWNLTETHFTVNRTVLQMTVMNEKKNIYKQGLRRPQEYSQDKKAPDLICVRCINWLGNNGRNRKQEGSTHRNPKLKRCVSHYQFHLLLIVSGHICVHYLFLETLSR